MRSICDSQSASLSRSAATTRAGALARKFSSASRARAFSACSSSCSSCLASFCLSARVCASGSSRSRSKFSACFAVCAVGLRVGGDGDQQRQRFVNVIVEDMDDPDFATILGMDFDSHRAAHRAALAARTGRRPMSPERIARWLDCGAQGSIALGEDGQAKNPLDQPALDWSRKQIAESKARVAAAEKREAAKNSRGG